MIKQIITPQYAKYDIVNSKMPDVFLDPTAKVKIFLYKTNQNFQEIFIDEDSTEQRIIDFSLENELDVWIGQNFQKQINPFQSASASKTIAMQTEIELYLLKDLKAKIEETFYFFTFEQITDAESANKTPKFLIKENTANLDKTKFRFSKIKAWQMSSTLFKQYQYWFFNKSVNLNRTKIKSIAFEIPSYSGFGNIRINGNNVLGSNPQEMAYKLDSIIHPFKALEPIAMNFSYKNGSLFAQLINWDVLGRCISSLKNFYFVLEGGTNEYWTMDFSTYNFGLVVALAGATTFPLPAGALYGLAEKYCGDDFYSKDASNDLKAYFWGKEKWDTGAQREFYNLKKCSPCTSLPDIEKFLREGNPIYNFNPWWNGYSSQTLGDLFYSVSMNVLNEENFEISNTLINNLKEAKQYSWVLMGQLNFYDSGVFSKRFSGRSSWTNSSYYSFGTMPYGFMPIDKIKKIWNTIRSDKILDTIKIFISFPEPIYLSSIEFNILFSDRIKTTITDINNITSTYENYTSFYLLGQDNVKTKLTFF